MTRKKLKRPEKGKPKAESKAGSRAGCQGADGTTAGTNNSNPPGTTNLMPEIVDPRNMSKAWERVKANQGSPGIDRMRVQDAPEYLRQHWQEIREAMLKGEYKPQPVKKVEIPKPNGGIRELGIPTVVDRLIQQAILQVLQPLWDPTFHNSSFGFRPNRSAHLALKQARELAESGRSWVVDVDLEKFFDRVNHDILMNRVARRVKDKVLLGLIRSYLEAGIMAEGVCQTRTEGTPQGGPLSPLLANLLLDEVDWELEKRGLSFCRYADDCNIYTRSRRSAQRAMRSMEKLTTKLKLKINQAKSAVARIWERKFLGYRMGYFRKQFRFRVSPEALEKFKQRVRAATRRNRGVSLNAVIKDLNGYLRGWKNYFAFAQTPRVFEELDGWIRRRLRQILLKQWRTSDRTFRMLVAQGAALESAKGVAGKRLRYWATSGHPAMNVAFPKAFFQNLDLVRLG